MSAHAQGDTIDKVYDFFEWVQKNLGNVGDETEKFIPRRRYELPEVVFDFKNLATTSDSRLYEEPVPASNAIRVEHMYGEIRVERGVEEIIRVSADVTVGAEKPDLARTVLPDIETSFTLTQDGVLLIRTEYPDLRSYRVATELNYVITVPPRVSVSSANLFGDTVIQGLNGDVFVEALYGRVHLEQLDGNVTVQSRGDFPLYAYWLRKGGLFSLQGTQAEFNHISGPLRVNNYLGKTIIQDCTAELIDARAENGDIHYFLVPGAQPDIMATAVYGDVRSDYPIDIVRRNHAVTGQSVNKEAAQRVSLESKLGNIVIHASPTDSSKADPEQGGVTARSLSNQVIPLLPGARLDVRGDNCNIIVESHDSPELVVSGEHVVLVRDDAQSDKVLDSIVLDVIENDAGAEVITGPTEDLKAIGGIFYRTDLRIRCPREVVLNVRAASGRVRAAQLAGSVDIEIDTGAIDVEHVVGALNILNRGGDITVVDCSGPLTSNGTGGVTRTRTVTGRQTITMENGQTVVDAPGGEVNVFQQRGPINVIAYDGISGNYDLRSVDGDISIVHPETVSADYIVTVHDGAVRSAWELAGTIHGSERVFRGSLNGGEYRINVEATRGDIALNR